jgi:hypothetical protein
MNNPSTLSLSHCCIGYNSFFLLIDEKEETDYSGFYDKRIIHQYKSGNDSDDNYNSNDNSDDNLDDPIKRNVSSGSHIFHPKHSELEISKPGVSKSSKYTSQQHVLISASYYLPSRFSLKILKISVSKVHLLVCHPCDRNVFSFALLISILDDHPAPKRTNPYGGPKPGGSRSKGNAKYLV